MIPMKAFAAVTLTGLGAGVLGVDAYMLSHTGPRAPVAVQLDAPVRVVAIERSAPSAAPAAAPVVVLAPVTVYARAPTPRGLGRKAPPGQLAPCSGWRTLESGPVGQSVRTLCVPGR